MAPSVLAVYDMDKKGNYDGDTMRVTIHCLNPLCGRECTKEYQPSRPPPRYCSISCAKVHSNAEKKANGIAAWRRYTFTSEMDAAIRLAYRGRMGSLKQLWHEDPRFERDGIPYPLVKRRTKQLGLTRTIDDDTWLPEESALCATLYGRGHALETIRKKLKAAGYTRSPSGIIAHMTRMGESRHQDFLAVSQFALALGLDEHVVGRWVKAGLLPVAYQAKNGRKQYLSYAAMRQFCLNYPQKAASGATDVVWLIALLVPPHVGDTREKKGRADDGGAWIQGSAIADRAAAD